MVDKTPAELIQGSASRGSVVHASDNGLGDLSRKHAEEDISRLQSAINDYQITLTYNIGDLVKESGFFWRCVVAVVTPQVFDENKWEFIDNSVSMFVCSYNHQSVTQNSFMPVAGNNAVNNGTETRIQAPVATAIVLFDYIVTIQANSRPDPTEWNMRVNGVTVNGQIIIGGGLTGNFEDLSNLDQVARGDQICYQVIEQTTTTGAITAQGSAVEYVRG